MCIEKDKWHKTGENILTLKNIFKFSNFMYFLFWDNFVNFFQ